MKAILREGKKVKGLRPNTIYDIRVNPIKKIPIRWMLRFELEVNIDGVWIPFLQYRDLDVFLKEWFVFQELPEQLKEQIRDAIEENAGATVCIPSIEEQEEMADNALNAVCAVLEGEQ